MHYVGGNEPIYGYYLESKPNILYCCNFKGNNMTKCSIKILERTNYGKRMKLGVILERDLKRKLKCSVCGDIIK